MNARRYPIGLAAFALAVATAPARPSPLTGDLTAACAGWTFSIDGLSSEGGPQAAAVLSCRGSIAIAFHCLFGDFIAGVRYFGDAAGPDGYRRFDVRVGADPIHVYLRLEAMDNAWAGYPEYDHPLLAAIRSEAGPIEIADTVLGTITILPSTGADAALEALRSYCTGP